MNSHIDWEQFIIKQKDELLPVTEMKTEVQDMECEIKMEPEGCMDFPGTKKDNADVKDKILAEAQFTSTTKTESKMLDTSDFFDIVLEDDEMKQENTEVDETDPITEEPECLTENVLHSVIEFYKAFISSTNDSVFQLNQAVCNLKIEDGVKSKLDMRIVKKNKYSCKLCNKSFMLVTDFDRHVVVHSIVHSNKKPFKCNLCGKYFHKTSIYRHLGSHRGQKHKRFAKMPISENQI